MKFRIGHGYDVHRISPERKMVLGGVEIPCGYGLEAHSDGDVLIHALIDALFGACALPDIGAHYPDTDERYNNADSMKLLADCINELDAVGYHVENIDCTVIAQAPKLAGYITDMRRRIAEVCRADIGDVNVKATTEEHLGFTGRGEGIAAHAVCLGSSEER